MLGEAGVKHIKVSPSPSLDLHQYTYRQNRSTDDTISTALHGALGHLEHRDSCVRMLFIVHCISAFDTIIPHILRNKQLNLGLPPSTCAWIFDFLTNRKQTVTFCPHLSSTITLSAGAHKSTTVLLCTNSHAYMDEIQRLTEWCSVNNLSLETTKTKEMILDFRRKQGAEPAPIYINGDCVERVHTFKFLGTLISEDLTCTANTCASAKKMLSSRCTFFREYSRKTNE